jgi:hypothetical protein
MALYISHCSRLITVLLAGDILGKIILACMGRVNKDDGSTYEEIL